MNKKSFLYLALILLVAILLRLWHIDKPEGMWNDEYLTWKIANANNISVDAIKKANNLTSNSLTVGQVLLLPSDDTTQSTNTYTVKSGDSLWKIANQYKLSPLTTV